MDSKQNPGATGIATGANHPHQINDKGPRSVARKPRPKEAGTPYRVTATAGETFRIVVAGRNRWALENLRRAGPEGCTPINNPAPRWSAYVWNLRELGVEIETITEPHGGDFAGHHARYVLRCHVVVAWEGGATC